MSADISRKPRMPLAGPEPVVRYVRPPQRSWTELRSKLREFVEFREVLGNLTRKQLKVRYKNSALGFVWSMLNPLLYLVVFYAVFNIFIPSQIPNFHVYLLAGLLPWGLLSMGLVDATASVVNSPGLVKKVYFPREMLPLSAIAARMIHFFLQFAVLMLFLIATRHPFMSVALVLVPLAVVTQTMLMTGIGFFFSATNVKARDSLYFLELALMAGFWMTPIVYPGALAVQQLAGRTIAGISLMDVYLANPMTRIVMAFQRGIYGVPDASLSNSGSPLVDSSLEWYVHGLGYALLIAALVLVAGWWLFHRFDAAFAEEI